MAKIEKKSDKETNNKSPKIHKQNLKTEQHEQLQKLWVDQS